MSSCTQSKAAVNKLKNEEMLNWTVDFSIYCKNVCIVHDVATHCTSVSKKLRSLPGSYSVVCFPLRKKSIILLAVPILCFMCISRSLYITSGIVVLWWTQVRWLCFPPLRALSLPEDPAINSIWCVLCCCWTNNWYENTQKFGVFFCFCFVN